MYYKYILILIFAHNFNYLQASLPGAEVKKLEKPGYEWFAAAKNANLPIIQRLSSTVDVNGRDKNGNTALMLAAIGGHDNIVKFLLTLPNIDINANEDGSSVRHYTALIWAAMYGRENIVKLLLADPKIKVNVQGHDGWSALLWAAGNSNNSITELLLKAPGINYNLQGKDGRTVLHLVAGQGLINSAKILLQLPDICINAQDKRGQTALLKALSWNTQSNREVASLIKSKIQELSDKAFEAIKDNNLEIIKIIVAQIGDNIVDSEGKTLLDKAFAANRPEIVLHLLASSQDPRELLAGFPFEAIPPTTELFKLCLELAYNNENTESTAQKDTISMSTENSCAQCATSGCTKQCGGCKEVYYCSSDCQKTHWKTHRSTCEA